ncbi:MAG: cell division ATP-binding protein FtsE [Bdellovibrio sp.]|nr:cell division ATP-binding protein FtsE [Bdellovibrio sp.]
MIHLKHIYKTYGANRHALRDLNIQIEKGEFTFLVGPSGAGKTTLFKLISAYEKPTTGDIEVAGYSLNSLKLGQTPFYRRKIGFVFQDYKLLKNKTVFQNVVLPLEIINNKTIDKSKQAMELLEQVGLHDLQDQYPDFLSGGEQQRVAIARALIHNPELLVADEPTGNLDPKMSEAIMQLFFEFSKKGTTFFVATHDYRLLTLKNSRVLELNKGELVGDRIS